LTTTADSSCPYSHHFTGKERDTESGNDYFEARYYSSAMGRFMSPDWSAKEEPVPYAKLDDPQSLNLYAYVYNNPLARADADGHWPACLSAAETYVEDGLAELVDKATADGAEMIAGAGSVSASAVAIGASVPLIVATIFAPPVGGDMTPEQQKEHQAESAPPKAQAGGAGARQGGGRNGLPPDVTKLKGNQGYKDKAGNTWKKDMKHKDHWDVSDKKGNKVKEVTFDGKQLWPDGQKNKNK